MPTHSELKRPAARLTLIAVASLTLGSGCEEPTRPGEGKVRGRWFQSQSFGYPNPTPLVAGASVYFASGGGYVIARDVETGAAKWTTSIGQSIHALSPEIGGANFVLRKGVLVTAVVFHTSALDIATGREIWRYHAPLDTIDNYFDNYAPRPGNVVEARIDADDSTVFVPAWGATVSAVDINTGRPRWVWRVEAALPWRSGASGVRVSGDTVFVSVWHFLNHSGTRSQAWLVALDKQSGTELWRVVLPRESTGTMIDCAPRIWNNLVFVTLASGDLFAVDRRDQHIAWHIPTQLPPDGFGFAALTSPQVYGDVVYTNGSDEMVHAYRASDGSQLWASRASQFTNDLLVTDKFIYATDGASIYVFNRITGARYGALGHPRKSASYVFSSGVAAEGGRVFATISDGAWSFVEP